MYNFNRREFMKLSTLSFASIALQLNEISLYAQKANGHNGRWDGNTLINWDAFLERLTKLAKAQHELPWDQEWYTQQVKHLLMRCNFSEFENIKYSLENYENKRENWFESETLHHEIDFQVSLFQFEKGEYISHHDHPNMTGVMKVISGMLHAKNYNIETQLDSTREVSYGEKTFIMKKCVIREVENEILTASDISILTADEGNIHSIMPNEFTQMIDVFTPAYQDDTKANWYIVNEEDFYNGQNNMFEAEYAINL